MADKTRHDSQTTKKDKTYFKFWNILLQETHSTPQLTQKWEIEWKGLSISHSGKLRKSSGLVILAQKQI